MNKVRIIEQFDSIQGEGHAAGTPMHFIRLAGCSRACPGCDTPQAHSSEQGDLMSVRDVVNNIPKHYVWVSITGGEPFEQAHSLGLLVDALHYRTNTKILLETNGEYQISEEDDVNRWITKIDWLCVSPKTFLRDHSLYTFAHELKIVVGFDGRTHSQNEKFLQWALVNMRDRGIALSIQPWMRPGAPGDANRMSMNYAVGLCKRYGIRLSPQLHKLLGIQ